MRHLGFVGALVVLVACGSSTEPVAPTPLVSTSSQITVTFANGQQFYDDSAIAFTVTNSSSSAIQLQRACGDTTKVMGVPQLWNGMSWVNIVTVCQTNHSTITVQAGASAIGTVTFSSCPGPAQLGVIYNANTTAEGIAYSAEFNLQVVNPSAAMKQNCGL